MLTITFFSIWSRLSPGFQRLVINLDFQRLNMFLVHLDISLILSKSLLIINQIHIFSKVFLLDLFRLLCKTSQLSILKLVMSEIKFNLTKFVTLMAWRLVFFASLDLAISSQNSKCLNCLNYIKLSLYTMVVSNDLKLKALTLLELMLFQQIQVFYALVQVFKYLAMLALNAQGTQCNFYQFINLVLMAIVVTPITLIQIYLKINFDLKTLLPTFQIQMTNGL